MSRMTSYLDSRDLGSFAGDKAELKWNRKDLMSLKEVVKLVPARGVAVQAGGCLGVFARYLARNFETVYTFEPFPASFVSMVANVPDANVVRFQAALGERHEMVDLVCELRDNDGHAELHDGMAHVERGRGIIPTLLLDDLALARCDLLYLDIEGYELFALRGAVETIRRCRPVIACEINRGVEYEGLAKDDVRHFLGRLGYVYSKTLRSDEVWLPHNGVEARLSSLFRRCVSYGKKIDAR